MPGTADKQLFTLGQLSEPLRKMGAPDVELHQLKYAIDRYRIAPITRIGILRVWSEDSLPLIKSALERIAASRGGRL